MKLFIVSDFPFTIEKSGYANQINSIIKKIIDDYNDIKIYFIGIGLKTTDCYNIDPLAIKDLNFEEKNYFDKIEIYSIDHKTKIFDNILKITTILNSTFDDKILFYCDLVYNDYYRLKNIKAKKYFWYPCHSSFNDNYDIVGSKYVENYKKIDNRYLNIFPIFDKLASFSNFGCSVLKSLNYNPYFINHTIDSNKYYNLNSKELLRNKLNIKQNSFICLMIGRNNCLDDRKAFKENLEGFKMFCDYYKSKSIYLILHAITFDKDINLFDICNELEINDKIITIPNDIFTLNNDYINILYNLSDVLLCNSKIEGFGLTSIEAQFADLPVVITDCSGLIDNFYMGVKTKPKITSNVINGINSFSIPDPKEICNALIKIYNNDFIKNKIPKTQYNINYIFKDWNNFLDLQDNLNIINLNQEKNLIVLFSNINLMKNINQIKNNYTNSVILIVNNNNNDKIYNIIKSLNLPNILFLNYSSKKFYFNIYQDIFKSFPFYKYYFFINDYIIQNNTNILNNNIYYSYKLGYLNKNENLINDCKKYFSDNLINFLHVNRKINLFTHNIILSCGNLYKLISYFNNITNYNNLFDLCISIYLSEHKYQHINYLN